MQNVISLFSGRYKKHCYVSLVDEIILFMIIVKINFFNLRK